MVARLWRGYSDLMVVPEGRNVPNEYHSSKHTRHRAIEPATPTFKTPSFLPKLSVACIRT